MREKEVRRSLSIFPIGTVIKLTDLTARQIRYYEHQGLVVPKRTDTNRRVYSMNDIDRLLEIKDYLADGLKLKTIKKIYTHEAYTPREKEELKQRESHQLSETEIRHILYSELRTAGGFDVEPGDSPRF